MCMIHPIRREKEQPCQGEYESLHSGSLQSSTVVLWKPLKDWDGKADAFKDAKREEVSLKSFEPVQVEHRV